jgi:UDPglucose 6-dehydrogenase
MREAPSITIVNRILELGGTVKAYDPQAELVARRIFGKKIQYAEKSYEALQGADALAIVTEWNEFREPDFPRMRKLLRSPIIFDGRNLYSPEQMKAQGFTYFSMGR